jgi:hypothetical protein
MRGGAPAKLASQKQWQVWESFGKAIRASERSGQVWER